MSCDLCVIGAGSGGLTVAAAAAKFGVSVVLIEMGKMGGDCLNYGCVPSKALIAAARRAQAIREAAQFGIISHEPRIDFAQVMAHVKNVIAAIEPKDSQTRFEGLGVKVIRAHGRFIDRYTVEAAGERITARRFVIATGSSPAIPPIPGLADLPYLTNETIFDLAELPRHLIIIGGGPVGVELAQAFRRLGSEVSIIEAAEPLGNEDPELRAVALEALRNDAVAIHSHARVVSIAKTGREIVLALPDHQLRGSHLLIAAGRRPNVEDLGLDTAGIAFTEKGIAIDSGLKTTNRKVYAIGDVTGGPQFTHLANYHAGLVIRNALFRLPVNASAAQVPRVIFIDPELAQVGLTEAEARTRHGEAVSVARSSFSDNDRAQIERRTQGVVKIVTGPRGRILGAGIAGSDAGELIQPFSLAISHGSRVKAFAAMIASYPTRGEAAKQAAIAHYAGLAANPWIRRVIGLLASFG
jgi:pyruvate/2-oxoglutarate dehydrogenase complex dihydrolipoamide dehydrogenase (E3) component